MLLLSAHCLVTLVSSGHCSCPALPSSCGIAMSKVYELLGIRTVLPFSLSELLCTICSSERGTNESLQRGPLNMVTCWLHSQLFTTARCGEDVLVFHSVACSPRTTCGVSHQLCSDSVTWRTVLSWPKTQRLTKNYTQSPTSPTRLGGKMHIK